MEDKALIDSCCVYLIENETGNSSLRQKPEFLDLLNRLIKRELEFYKLVEYLGSRLTNVEIKERTCGVCLLADILHNLPANYLNLDEINYLVTFFCDRLKDQQLVIPHAIRSLVTLTCDRELPNGCAQQVVSNLFREVETQRYNHPVRQNIYILLANLLKQKLNELQEIDADFLLGFVQAVDGEKDPRSLLIVFNMVPFIVANFKIDHLTEELFEVISCYFPIDFTPPPSNPHGVTKEDLVLALRKCLASTTTFAPFCIPLLLEKIDSSLIDAKIDALQTLAVCSEIYDSEQIKTFFPSIWSSIRREVLLGTSEEVELASLTAIKSIIKTSSSSLIKADSKSTLDEYLEEICKECEKYLCQPELKLMHPSSRILQAAASSSNTACEKILQMVVPLLINQFNLHTQENKRKTILDILNNFFLVSKHKQIVNNSQDLTSSVALYLTLLGGDSDVLRHCALVGFETMLCIPDLLDESTLDVLSQHLIHLTITHPVENIRKFSNLCLTTFANNYSNVIDSGVVPKLFNTIESVGINIDSINYNNALIAVGSICVNEELLIKIVPKLVVLLKKLLVSEKTDARISMVIDCLRRAITNQNIQSDSLGLSDLVISTFSTISQKEEVDVVPQLSGLFREITRSLNPNLSHRLIQQLMTIVVPKICENNSSQTNPVYNLIPLFASFVCSLPKDDLVSQDVGQLIPHLEFMIQTTQNENCALASSQMLASIINKFPSGEKLNELIKSIANCGDGLINSSDTQSQTKGLNVYIWLCKALLLRGHQYTENYVDKIIEFMSNNHLGRISAEAFEIILSENDEILSTKCNANIRLMYRQFFYQITVTKLISGFNNSETNDKRSNYLIAVLHQLPHMPEQVLTEEIQSLIPLLCQGLSLCEEVNLMQTTLNTFSSLITQFPSSLTSHVTSLIPHFLRISQNGTTLMIRKAGLTCLNATTNQPADVILPLKNQVIKGLATCLDDKKRLVRQTAVVARGNWYLLGAPGGTTN